MTVANISLRVNIAKASTSNGCNGIGAVNRNKWDKRDKY